MSYNLTLLYAELEAQVENLASTFVTLETRIQQAFAKLSSVKSSRGPSNQEVADSFSPGETVPVEYINELEQAITDMKSAMDAATLTDIRKFS